MAWTNSDGLPVRFHREEGTVNVSGRVPAADTTVNRVLWKLDYSKFNGTTGTQYETPSTVFIPKGATLVRATLVVTTGFTSGGSATLDIGLQQKGGTEIDNDGIDAAIAKTAIDTVGEQVACDGALVATTGGGKLGYNAYLYVKAGTAAFTAGKADLVVEYIMAD